MTYKELIKKLSEMTDNQLNQQAMIELNGIIDFVRGVGDLDDDNYDSDQQIIYS